MKKTREPTDTERFLQGRCWNGLTNKEKECILYLQSLGHRLILKNKIELRGKHQVDLIDSIRRLALFKLRFIKKYPERNYKLHSPRGRYIR